MTSNFYVELPILETFRAVLDTQRFTAAPDDWLIVLTDIQNSTQAIEAGQYKAVNMIGASSIMALLNVDREFDLPFSFGGDGATILIPPILRQQAVQALRGLQTIARQEFSLHLRAGIVPVADVSAAGERIMVARYRVAANHIQAVFAGGGLSFAERLIKQAASAPRYAIPAASGGSADLNGLECRWQDVPSPHGETVSLLIQALGRDDEHNAAIYRNVIGQIDAIYGPDPQRHPVRAVALQPSLSMRALDHEARARTPGGWWRRSGYLAKIWAQNILFRLFVRHNVTTGLTNWRTYVDVVQATTDVQKYDDMLRMLIAGNLRQRLALVAYLRAAHERGDLCYGLHVADRALLTCIVFDRMGRQVHFVDGADGGYARAAAALKELVALAPPAPAGFPRPEPGYPLAEAELHAG
ncbi:MAG TPA: DUF3095 domain-containing protein [Herpetosiphonaceae bacterium]|nr:DUF3095 domain-containing protein [Herpetosiphonaceae bacterium]